MYQLTLTREERKAFDWVGDRYNAGEIADLLCDTLEEDFDWDRGGDITFDVPEYIASQINDLAEEEDYAFPCFSPELKEKMVEFCNSII